jgi:hypothetical protein
MATFTATVTDTAGQTSTVTFTLGDPMRPGSDGTPSLTWAVAPTAAGATLEDALAAFTAAVPGFTRLYASSDTIPASVYSSGTAALALRTAAAHGMSAYLACASSYTSDAFTPAPAAAALATLTGSMLAAGITGYLCLDPCPQDDNPAWRIDLAEGSPARLAAARWRAGQRAAARAVWAADPSGRIGYSTTVLASRAGLLPASYWDPAASHTDDLPGQVPWDGTERSQVLLSVTLYPVITPAGAQPMDEAAADYSWWNTTAGYTRMGLGLTAYNTDAAYPAHELRIAELIRGTSAATGLAITGSLGEWVTRKRADGSLRQLAWDDSYHLTGAAGLHGSARESAQRAAALAALAATTTTLPYPEPSRVTAIVSGESFGAPSATHITLISPGAAGTGESFGAPAVDGGDRLITAPAIGTAASVPGPGVTVGPPPPLERVNTAAGGTSGTAATTGNTGGASGDAFDSVTVTAPAALTFDDSLGVMAYKVANSVSGGLAWEGWDFDGSTSTCGGRIELYMNTYTDPSASVLVLGSIMKSPGNNMLLWTNPDGSLQILEQGIGQVVLSPAATLPLNTWFRIEYGFDFASSGSYQVQLFPDTTTTTASWTASGARSFTGSQTYTGVRYGFDSSFENISFWFKNVLASNANTLPGPA